MNKIYIWLFIAEDGEFIYSTLDTVGQKLVVRPVVLEVDVLAGRPDDLIKVGMKVYRRYRIAFDGREWEGVPPLKKDAYLRQVIKELEARGDAPWKRVGDTGV